MAPHSFSNKLFLSIAAFASLASALPKPHDHAEVHRRNLDLANHRVLATSSPPVTTSYSSSIPTLQSPSTTASQTPETTGSVITTLESSGNPSAAPFPTSSIATPSGTISELSSSLAATSVEPTAALSSNIFVPIATDAPPAQVSSRADHPQSPVGVAQQTTPLETNKFYANFFLGTQAQPAWTHPYSVVWAAGSGTAGSYGLAISHIERSQLAWAPGTPPEYFVNPAGIQSVALSAAELGSSTVLTTDTLEAFSVNVNLAPSAGADPLITYPLLQGMGFVTGKYTGATPWLQSGVFFQNLVYVGSVANGAVYKYRITLNDQTTWLMYVTPSGSVGAPAFTLTNSTRIEGPSGFSGTIQVAKNPGGSSGETAYDKSAGAYAVNATICGCVDGSTGNYTIEWTKTGITSQTLLMFALPHQVDSLSGTTSSATTSIQLETTTKGMATAILADQFTMIEPNLPTEIGFAPWTPTSGSSKALSTGAVAAVNDAGATELAEDFDAQTNLNSMYYSGKGLAKFAFICYAMNDLAQNEAAAAAGLAKLKDAFNVFVSNTQQFPLAYDTVWHGAVSSASYGGDSGADFGNTFYNDHHFHYGYFVYAAAVIGYLDPAWLTNGTNKAWVNMLVRDYANSITTDPYFPFQRSFDWYHGHSWAKGLFESGDGKDEESSSEDAFATYALKMWGQIIGDANMEARANLQLAVQARSLQHYFLLESNNTVQPAQFIPNKVTGILFENKVDHVTYFGANPEYIEGIHMIPLNPSSTYTRTKNFVTEEWATYFDNGRANNVTGGWKGILYANYAIIDPVTSYNFFASSTFDSSWLDGGASRTWYLAYAAGLGGA